MSILTQNTTSLQTILSMLGDSSGSGSGGSGSDSSTSAQYKTGSFRSSGNSTTRLTIDCGFSPDVVIITTSAQYTENGFRFINAMCADFSNASDEDHATVMTITGDMDTNTTYVGGYVEKLSNGFNVYNFYEQYMNGDWDYVAKDFSYTAIKYK